MVAQPQQPVVPLVKRRTPFVLPASLGIYLDPDEDREIIEEVADELEDEWWEDLDAAFPPNDPSGIVKPLPAPERFQRYMLLTRPDDIDLLTDSEYPKLAEQGLMPPLPVFLWTTTGEPYVDSLEPMAYVPLLMEGLLVPYYWGQMQAELPRDFKRKAGDFRRLWNQYNRMALSGAGVSSSTTSPVPETPTPGGY